jgi:hypothetical protein
MASSGFDVREELGDFAPEHVGLPREFARCVQDLAGGGTRFHPGVADSGDGAADILGPARRVPGVIAVPGSRPAVIRRIGATTPRIRTTPAAAHERGVGREAAAAPGSLHALRAPAARARRAAGQAATRLITNRPWHS